MIPSSPTRRRLLGTVSLVVAVTLAACGGDDAADPAEPAATAAPVPTEPAEPAATTVDSPTTDAAAVDETLGGFPVTIEHKYGSTTIAAPPERIVSVGFAEHESLLALGLEPVGVRDWYGDQPYATWPWAQDELGDAQPEVIAAEALNFEQIAALQPDLIVGILSGMTDTDYATLSAIAPTLAQSADYVEYGSPWDVTLTTIGRATGRVDEAARIVADTTALLDGVRAAHPEWEGLTAGVTYIYESQPGGYASQDPRARFLADIGLATPAHYDELAGDQFWFTVSPERLPELDADVLLWFGDTDADIAAVRDLPLRDTLSAYTEGREILVDPLLAGAFSHGSPLSFEYVVEHLVPQLEAALDGDPATVVESAAAIDPHAD